MPGRIDVHSHLLPGIDDGCQSVDESIRCARMLVENGYTHSFCTPHIWPSLPKNTIEMIRTYVTALQEELDEASVPLTLIPGGENNFGAHLEKLLPEHVVTFGMERHFVLIDLWADRVPDGFKSKMQWFQSLELTVVLAHPERMRAVQENPELAQTFIEMGLQLQGNLQCFTDAPEAATRRTAERFLLENRYTYLGSDLHALESLPRRLEGLRRVIELVGNTTADRLTIDNPRQLLPVVIS